ncbi:MAG: hypothetical protein KAW17_01230 [Candidatus Eisenbacteria sp.]|nr:hypothetical protein [Candidatus Eisenbacteria bacterium]
MGRSEKGGAGRGAREFHREETAGFSGAQQDLLVAAVLAVLTVILFHGFLFSNRMFFGTDIIPGGYMARKVYTEFLVSGGGLPLWNPYILGGLPFIDALHGPALYPATLMNFIMPVHRFIGAKLVLHIFLAGICMYAFLRARGLERLASGVGGMGYMFAPYIVSLMYAGHDAKLYVTALLPLAFYCLEKGLQTRRMFHFAMMGGSVGLMFLTSHVQMAAYALWGLGLYVVFRLVEVGRGEGSWKVCLRPAVLFVLGIGIGFALGLVQFLPSYIYTKGFSPRAGGVSYEFATSWSLHPEEIVSLVIPQFVHYLGDYWGRNPFKLNCEAPGFIVLILAAVALCHRWSQRAGAVFVASLLLFFVAMVTTSAVQGIVVVLSLAGFIFAIVRARDLAFFLLISVFALFYSVGAHTPAYRVFFHVIPGVEFFRAPSTIMMLFLFASAALAGVGADRLQSIAGLPEGDRIVRNLLWTTMGGVVVLIVLAVGREQAIELWNRGLYPDLGPKRSILEANYPKFLRGLMVAIVLLAGTAFCSWVAVRLRGRVRWAMAGLGLLVVASVWPLDRDFIQYVRVEDFVRRDPIIQTMAKDEDLFRVLPLTGSTMYDRNYLPIFGFQTLNGFHDNRLRVYDEITGEGRLLNPRILDLYNTKYVITGRRLTGGAFEEVMTMGDLHLYRNRTVLPRAFVVFDYEVIPQGADAMERLLEPEFDYRRTLILAEHPPGLTADQSRDPVQAEVLAYGPNEIRVGTRTEAPGLLFLGDNYFPYWRGSVDGRAVPVLRCDCAFRAVPVPAGSHEVVLRYRSEPLVAGGIVSGAFGVLVLGWMVVHLGRRFSRKGSGPE